MSTTLSAGTSAVDVTMRPEPRPAVDATATTPARILIPAESSARPPGVVAATAAGAESGGGVGTGATARVESGFGRALSATGVTGVTGGATGWTVADDPPL